MTDMQYTQMAKYVLPPAVVDVARWLLAECGRTRPEAGQVRTHYKVVPAWRPSKEGTGTFDAVKRPADAELDVPIVRDNLEALTLINAPEVKLLDFGCGNGHYQSILSACAQTAKWNYTGADVRPAFVQWCRQTYPGVQFETVEEGCPLPFADNEFDVVLASSVLQYIEKPGLTLTELRRVTQQYVLVSRLPTRKYQDSQIVMQHLQSAWGEEQYPLHVFNRHRLEDLFEQTGFAVLWRDYGSECFTLPGDREPVIHLRYLLQKTCPW
jgi:putative methyltransferase (TIGR04325 family)